MNRYRMWAADEAEREAIVAMLRGMGMTEVAQRIEDGEHFTYADQQAERKAEQVAKHPNFMWEAGMLAVSQNDGTKYRLVGVGEEPRLVNGTLLPNAAEWQVPGSLATRYIPDLDDPATGLILSANWLPEIALGTRLADALLEKCGEP